MKRKALQRKGKQLKKQKPGSLLAQILVAVPQATETYAIKLNFQLQQFKTISSLHLLLHAVAVSLP